MIHIIYNKSKQPINWELRPTNKEEHKIAATIRNLQFFELKISNTEENTDIVYNGITLINDAKGKVLGNLKTIS
jgi:hypothetical protein